MEKEKTTRKKSKHVHWSTSEYNDPHWDPYWDPCSYQCAQAEYHPCSYQCDQDKYYRKKKKNSNSNPSTDTCSSNSKAEINQTHSDAPINQEKTKKTKTNKKSKAKKKLVAKKIPAPDNNPGTCRPSVIKSSVTPSIKQTSEVKTPIMESSSSFSIKLTPYFRIAAVMVHLISHCADVTKIVFQGQTI